MIQQAGFCIDRMSKGYMGGPKLMTFFFEGSAQPI